MTSSKSPDMGRLLMPNAIVPTFQCPTGTKMHILDLGTLRLDQGWMIRGAGGAKMSEKNPEHTWRDLIVISALIDHPDFGLILFETGCSEDIDHHWGPPLTDIFPRTEYEDHNKLPNAIKAKGYDIKDVKAVLFGHLHLDHAGGLEHFIGTDVPIIVHEEEFKHACWATATGADHEVYLSHYLDIEGLNWKTFNTDHFDLCQGISLHFAPGHTPGLCIMQINLEKDGTFIWTTDMYHLADNYELGQPQGWLARDHFAWFRSSEMIKRMQKQFKATLIFGHDKDVAMRLMEAKPFYQ